jgi:hypothetical protein
LGAAFACGLAFAAHWQVANNRAASAHESVARHQAAIGHVLAWHGIDGARPAPKTASRAGGVMAPRTAVAR